MLFRRDEDPDVCRRSLTIAKHAFGPAHRAGPESNEDLIVVTTTGGRPIESIPVLISVNARAWLSRFNGELLLIDGQMR